MTQGGNALQITMITHAILQHLNTEPFSYSSLVDSLPYFHRNNSKLYYPTLFSVYLTYKWMQHSTPFFPPGPKMFVNIHCFTSALRITDQGKAMANV